MNQPIRLFMTADTVGGVWQYATDLASGLVPKGVETVLAVLGPAPDIRQRAMAEQVPGLRLVETGLPLDWLSEEGPTRAAASAIASLARDERADIVHLNSPALAGDQRFVAPVVAAAHGCVRTWWEAARGDEPLDRALRWHQEMMARGLRSSDAVIAPSASHAEALRRCYGLAALPRVVHNGRALPAVVGPAAQHDCAFTAGRLWDEAKNTATLDAAAAMLPFPLHAAGSVTAPHGAQVQVEHMHLLGQLDDAAMARWLARRPVFVSAATFEPFGLAVLEAAASGCALVLSDIGTFRELWDGAAVFVPPGDAAAFAEAIEQCVEDLPLRAALGNAAQARARRYSVERMAATTAALYRELLGARLAA